MPLHVAVEFGPDAHGVHEVPHVAGSVLPAQAVPHAWKAAPQLNPHAVPLQVAAPLAGATHGVHDPPHVAGSVLLAQAVPHA